MFFNKILARQFLSQKPKEITIIWKSLATRLFFAIISRNSFYFQRCLLGYLSFARIYSSRESWRISNVWKEQARSLFFEESRKVSNICKTLDKKQVFARNRQDIYSLRESGRTNIVCNKPATCLFLEESRKYFFLDFLEIFNFCKNRTMCLQFARTIKTSVFSKIFARYLIFARIFPDLYCLQESC